MTQIKTDFLIIGSGVAGLTFALKVAEFGDVALVMPKVELPLSLANSIHLTFTFRIRLLPEMVSATGMWWKWWLKTDPAGSVN